MKRLCLFLVLIFLMSYGIAHAQTAKEAYKALKKVEARTETGISYKEYPQIIADAKVEVDGFLETKEANKKEKFANHIKKAMDYYLLAGNIWRIEFSNIEPENTITANSQEGKLIAKLYPKARAELIKRPREGDIIPSLQKEFESYRLRKGPVYYIPEILKNIWADASKELKAASEFLKSN